MWQSIALILDIYPVYLTGGISYKGVFLFSIKRLKISESIICIKFEGF